MERIVLAFHRLYARIRHRDSASVALARPTGSVDDVNGRRHCLVVTYRRDGRAVPTPVWFGSDNGRLYFRAEGASGKAKRIRNSPVVRIAPCTGRGKPLGPPFDGTARIITGDEAAHAETVIQAHYSLGRRFYERWFTLPEGVYVEVTPDIISSQADRRTHRPRTQPAPVSGPSSATSR